MLVDALMEVKGADAAFSPGFRWGTTLLPGDAITMERLMDQTAITYPQTTLTNMTGEVVRLGTGQTWIHVVPKDWTISSQ